mmetsp:Transcript_120155/g.340083  ORF Transcript_120155/g.340083 Transcript_120155/m.340083 type:complete len:327 (-) Transcript_120155:1016-1996(-)
MAGTKPQPLTNAASWSSPMPSSSLSRLTHIADCFGGSDGCSVICTALDDPAVASGAVEASVAIVTAIDPPSCTELAQDAKAGRGTTCGSGTSSGSAAASCAVLHTSRSSSGACASTSGASPPLPPLWPPNGAVAAEAGRFCQRRGSGRFRGGATSGGTTAGNVSGTIASAARGVLESRALVGLERLALAGRLKTWLVAGSPQPARKLEAGSTMLRNSSSSTLRTRSMRDACIFATSRTARRAGGPADLSDSCRCRRNSASACALRVLSNSFDKCSSYSCSRRRRFAPSTLDRIVAAAFIRLASSSFLDLDIAICLSIRLICSSRPS